MAKQTSNSSFDEQVQKLQEKVAEKKAKIAKAERPSWATNMAYRENENSSSVKNLQVIQSENECVEILGSLIQKKEAYDKAAQILDIKSEFKHCGYSFEDWKSDLIKKASIISLSKEKAKLKQLESMLEGLESEEVKKAKQLASISAALED